MTTRRDPQWLVFILFAALSSLAQQQPATGDMSDAVTGKSVDSGVVSGHVYLSDTKGPARRATVRLQPASLLQSDLSSGHDQGRMAGAVTIEVPTHFDGSFSLTHVPAGDYYVIASCPGYVSPYLALSLSEHRSQRPNQQPITTSEAPTRATILKRIPRILVQSGLATAVDITLERGAAISGNVSFDDGTPAAGLRMELLARVVEDGKETWSEPFLSFPAAGHGTMTSTDDRGNYRISGLPAGKYRIAASFDLSQSVTYLSSNSSGTNTSFDQQVSSKIYSGNTPRLKQAAVISLSSGEEYGGEDMQFPLSKLHTITGHIVSAHDGHIINSGQVDLLNSDDGSLAASGHISADTSEFILNFIYDGEYILSSPTSADVEYQLLPQAPGSLSPLQYNAHLRHRYGSVSKPLYVDGNMDGVTIEAPELTAKEAQMFNDAIEREKQRQSAVPHAER